MVVGADVRVATLVGRAGSSQNDDAGRAPVDAQRATSADVVVDDEQHLVAGILTRQFGSGCLDDGLRSDHVNALPWTDVDASLAHDALGLVDVDELFRLD